MKVQYIEKTKIAYFNGKRFTRDDKTGYYLGTVKENGKRQRLHRYIWEYYNGEIPKGYDIHHKDHNKDNNELDNLELITRSQHSKLHCQELTEEQKQKRKDNLEKKARPKAIEWHKSEKAKTWHKEQYKRSLGALEPRKYICDYCGKEYMARPGTHRFCSGACGSAWRRKSGLDDIQRKCIICGKEFTINKYSKTQKCKNCIPDRYKKH